MFPIIALFQGIYANWTKLSIFDQYNENIGQHSKKKLCIRKNESMSDKCPKCVGFVRNDVRKNKEATYE